MAPFQERVVAEKAALDSNIEKLVLFIEGDVYDTLPDRDCELLEAQLSCMRDYSEVLEYRIARFAKVV